MLSSQRTEGKPIFIVQSPLEKNPDDDRMLMCRRRFPSIARQIAGCIANPPSDQFLAGKFAATGPFSHHVHPHVIRARGLKLQTVHEQPVRIERLSGSDSGIVEVKLDRPGAKNAIGKEMLKGLKEAIEMISSDSSANVLMIQSSVPKVFCAGADLKERKLMSPSEVQLFVNSLRTSYSYIGVIEGAALGGGLELVLSCDLRICGEAATFSMPETGLAIIPGAGGTQRLPRLVGKSVAKDLIFTGRKIDANDAMSIGLVNHSVPLGEAYSKALEIAREINQKGPLAVRMAKRAINKGLEVEMSSALALEEDCYEKLLNTKDRLEGLAAFAEKRRPRYSGE
ncbi:Peroxisomal fatty acid beta-oxidation multifunctional protein AIM1 [Acorus calamus]|uniref:Peroxisomal fatty acid beta-oxidation multifunctional protein AIM1 n=1 Tax=Acorus calamus TaxID=4465 RepID=A0AAV9FNG3_ACOCL|nr:Peroxisomal fatty acid beta-oxidation multifunctional protein AIM1 [Acorus calamus]